jgi:hypothetical protein
MKLFFILFLLYIKSIESILLILNSKKENCIYKDISNGDRVHLSFIVSGDVENLIHCTFTSPEPSGKLLYSSIEDGKKINKGSFELEISKSGLYSLCFFSSEEHESIVSFDLFTDKETGQFVGLAKDETFEQIYKNITIVSYLFEEVERNIKYYIERSEIHSNGK